MTKPSESGGGRQLRINMDAAIVPGTIPLEAVLLSDRQVCLNSELAKAYLDTPIFAGEREAQEPHVQTIVDAMLNGTFNHRLVILATGLLDGVTYKINGQHTSWAVWMVNGVRPGYSIEVRELRYRCANEDQLRALYGSFDQGLGRTKAHVTTVLTVNTPELHGVAASALKRLVPGLRLWLFPDITSRERCGPNQIAALMRNTYAAQCRYVGKFLQTRRVPHMFRAPVIAAQLATFDVDPDAAVEFWDAINTGLNLESQSDPRWRLRELLLNTRLSNVRDMVAMTGPVRQNGAARLLGAESMYRCCIAAWNKWRAGETMASGLRAAKDRPQPK